MDRWQHPSLTVTLAMALVAIIGVETADVAVILQENSPELSALFCQCLREKERLATLTEQQAFLLASYQAREQAVGDLLAERRTFLETAARFHALNQRRAPGMTLVGAVLPGATAEERACHQVIRWVESTLLAQSPSEAPAVSAALDHELEGQLDCFGTVQLPQP